jgi:uncharacterized membrane protein YbhN (UPF0104 family)
VSATAAVTPFEDQSRRKRLTKVFIWLGVIAVVVLATNLLGVDVWGWLSNVWDQLTSISVKYIVAGCALQALQITMVALGWYYIFRAGFPNAEIKYRSILAAYAAGATLNNYLPANIGTFTSLLMYTALITGATFTAVVGGYLVQKIFFTVAGTVIYAYLFISVPGSFSIELGNISAHPVLWAFALAGGALLVALLIRVFWKKLEHLWDEAKQGGAILARPRDYFIKVFLPSLISYCAKLGVIAVFLAAYGIPVTLHTVIAVQGGNSIAGTVTVTPGGAGVNQAMNNASLRNVTDPATATAYSVGQQLIITAFNTVFAIVLVVWAFGWTGGKALVSDSYAGAKEKAAEQKQAHEERKVAKKEAKRAAKEAGEEGPTVRERFHQLRGGDDEDDDTS